MTKCKCLAINKDGIPCLHTWYPRQDPDTIVSCPRCKSRRWKVAPAPPSSKVESLEERNKREVDYGLAHEQDASGCIIMCANRLCPFCNPDFADKTPGRRCS